MATNIKRNRNTVLVVLMLVLFTACDKETPSYVNATVTTDVKLDELTIFNDEHTAYSDELRDSKSIVLLQDAKYYIQSESTVKDSTQQIEIVLNFNGLFRRQIYSTYIEDNKLVLNSTISTSKY